MDREELERIIEASRYVHGNTKRSEPEWIWKNRQLGFERYQAEDLLMRTLFPKDPDPEKEVFALAIKIIKGGTDFTAEELQLQVNEPEVLEKMLKELNEFLNKKDG